MAFNYSQDFKRINFRRHPELYHIGKGEQGVLLVEPYKSEILPHWKFKTPLIAKASAEKIYSLFLKYRRQRDFVGMDMARKFLQMGYTRSRRYANHPSGNKYVSPSKKERLPQAADWATNEKAQSARVFYKTYVKAREDKTYVSLRAKWSEKRSC